eukprot:scaffold33511_cov69-Amphora_coffeaeformis.AAC.1
MDGVGARFIVGDVQKRINKIFLAESGSVRPYQDSSKSPSQSQAAMLTGSGSAPPPQVSSKVPPPSQAATEACNEAIMQTCAPKGKLPDNMPA